ncbi:hypothetical protein [Thermoactinomyces sp. DSM 45892]|uniref:hypothetical protein n=1 Tax=Thermoactinomyces sp. DSM 45892 TaxID=1882753 RepID=UPI00089C0FCC|nr:hypothetical protein [Thermoactinomyces sp. DSM 45892]SDY58488.1 hypothetical protein SAMN05444416_10642 [Thermoactinomyces sp. DSM 45892]
MKCKHFIAGVVTCSAIVTGAGISMPSFTHADDTKEASFSQPQEANYTVISNALTEKYTLGDKGAFGDFAFFTPTEKLVRVKITTSQLNTDKKVTSSWQLSRKHDTADMFIPVTASFNVKNGETKEFIARVKPGMPLLLGAVNFTGNTAIGEKPLPITGTITIDYIKVDNTSNQK